MKQNRFKRILSIILSLVMLLSITSGMDLSIFAETQSGTCGDDVTWTLDDYGTLTINGIGEMTKYYYDDHVSWYSYRDKINKIVISDGVTSIGGYAFEDCYNLTSVTIPDSVTSIGESVFYHCSSLTSVTIPDGVTSIGDSVFSHCSSLTSITIPDGVTSIGLYTFSGCSSLTSVTIANGVTSIDSYAFRGCTGLTSVTIPDSVTSIGYGAFERCSSLKSVTIGNNVTSISDDAFAECTSLTSVTIPDSVTSIGEYAFENCSSLTKITMGKNVSCVGYQAFENTAYFNDESNWTDDVLYIDNALIKAKESISGDYKIKDNTSVVAGYAFYKCSNLTSVSIPDGVLGIGDDAFAVCEKLLSVNLPESIISVGYAAFVETAYYRDRSNWEGNALYIDKVLIKATGNCTVKENTLVIADYAFYSHDDTLTKVTIPNTVTTIGNMAFGYCQALQSITIPKSVTSISQNAFAYCFRLKKIYYRGTQEEWDKIGISLVDNDLLLSARLIIHSECVFVEKEKVLPTCLKGGATLYQCDVCYSSYKTYDGEALGHKPKLVEVEDSNIKYICVGCQRYNTKTCDQVLEMWDDEFVNAPVERGNNTGYLDVVDDGVINAKDYAMLLRLAR